MSIEDRVLGFLREPGGEAEFQALALAVFAHQYGSTPVYRRFCELRGLDPARVRRWSEIPALPADAFKLDLEPRGRPHVFLSSGTTAGPDRRSCHAVSSLTTYRESALGHFRRMVLADGAGPFAVAVLGPTAASHPHSSLGRMFSWCAESFSSGDTLFALDGTGRLDLEAALTWLGARAEGREPVLILTLSSALTAVFDALRSRGEALRLPAESRIVDTGGRKGRQRVFHVVSPGRGKRNLSEMLPAPDHPEPVPHPLGQDPVGPVIRLMGEPVGDERLLERGDELLDVGVVHTQDGEPVKGNLVDKLDERCLYGVEVAVMVEVLLINRGDDSHVG